MPLAPFGVFDLSSITDKLISILTACNDKSSLWNPNNLPVNPGPPFTISITGASPEAARANSDKVLSLYLFHVEEDKFQKNLPPQGKISPLVPPIQYTPLALDLYYLLTAYAKDDYVTEQRAMTVAMRCLHDNPIVHMNVVFGAQVVPEEFVVSIEQAGDDELSRLWQAFVVPLRMSAVYKVSVALISPEAVIAPLAPHPTHITITADPAVLPFAAGGQVVGTAKTFQFRKQDGTLSDPLDLAPATAVPNQPFFLYGAGFQQNTSDHIYLLNGTVESEITGWLAPAPAQQTDSRYTLLPPNAVGLPPGNALSPPPGVYQLRVGDAGAIRSNATPFSVAPRVDVTLNPPILPGPVYTIGGLGFSTGSTEVLLDAVPLTPGAPGAGNFQINGAETQITFQIPANLPVGFHAVRIRVNQVEADPAWWVQVP